jgi:hypothetical protein
MEGDVDALDHERFRPEFLETSFSPGGGDPMEPWATARRRPLDSAGPDLVSLGMDNSSSRHLGHALSL